jgi:hypothetical protein
MWFFSGMETPLLSLLTIAAVCGVALDPARTRWAPFAASVAGVGLMMTRPDGVVIVAALALAAAVLDGGWIVRERRWARAVIAPALPLVLVFVPYQLWRIWFYGSVLPNTYYAKVAYLTYYWRGWTYARHYVAIYAVGWFLLWPVLGAALARPGPARRFLIAAGFTTAGAVFYVIRLGGDFMEWRFLTPVSGVFYPAVVVGAAVVGERLAGVVRLGSGPLGGWVVGAGAAAALALLTARAAELAQTRSIPDQETIPLLRRYAEEDRFDWRAAAQAFDAVVPADARIATTAAGMLPYFCDRPCLDLHGLTDPVIARAPVDPHNRGRMGHEHWLSDPAEMRRRGVDIVLEWVVPTARARAAVSLPSAWGELMSVRLSDGRYVDFTLLNPTLAPRLRAHPRVVAFDPAALADPRRPYSSSRRYGSFTVVDALDWGSALSETAHHFHAWSSDSGTGPTRTKGLYYQSPDDTIALVDDGRTVDGAAWQVHAVDAARDLFIVARFDHAGAGVYEVEVNGHPTRRGLGTSRRHAEAWGESVVQVPKSFLRAGTNDVRISRRATSPAAGPDNVHCYYMWFLQPRE